MKVFLSWSWPLKICFTLKFVVLVFVIYFTLEFNISGSLWYRRCFNQRTLQVCHKPRNYSWGSKYNCAVFFSFSSIYVSDPLSCRFNILLTEIVKGTLSLQTLMKFRVNFIKKESQRRRYFSWMLNIVPSAILIIIRLGKRNSWF